MERRGGIVCNLEIRVLEDGKIISEKIGRSHSFTNNFIYSILRSMDGVGNSDLKNTAGGAIQASGYYFCRDNYSIYAYQTAAGMNTVGSSGDISKGIVIGTSNTPFSISQYNMGAIIANGSGSGQMSYGAMTSPSDPVFSTPNILFTSSRNISNNSGSPITVREIGLKGYPTYGLYCIYAGMHTNNAEVLFLRDVIADTIVGTGQILNVVYILKTVV